MNPFRKKPQVEPPAEGPRYIGAVRYLKVYVDRPSGRVLLVDAEVDLPTIHLSPAEARQLGDDLFRASHQAEP